jgi:alanine racemase
MARPSEALIDLAAIGKNFEIARERAAGREVIAVVKADAYGHGAVPVARALVRRGCTRFAVLSVEEMVALREAGIDAPVLVLAGPHDSKDAHEIVRSGATAVLHHAGQIEWLGEATRGAAQPLAVHIEVDTGMRRMGVAPTEAGGLFEALERRDSLALRGVLTHFSSAEEADLGPSEEQLERFARLLQKHAPEVAEVHVANSAGLLAAPRLALMGTGVRPGLMLYGARPAAHLGAELSPAMRLETEVIAVRHVDAGEGVGYGGAWCAPDAGQVATIGLGYADGIPRSLGGVGEVEIAGRRAPLVGRVSMDSAGVWLAAQTATVGASVCVFGSEGLRVEEVAERAATISYELLVRVGARVTRRYIGD